MTRSIFCAAFLFLCTSLAAPLLPAKSAHDPAFAPRLNPQEAVAGDEAAEADSQPATVFRTSVRNLFNEEKFDQLDEIAANVRAQKARFLGGAWKLHEFYRVIQGPGSLTDTDAVWNAHFDRLERWIGHSPESVTPRVALAMGYLRFAWKARGNGFANKVTGDAWKLFGERIQKSRDTLEQAKSVRDPEWYRTMQTVALAQGWDRKQAEKLLAEAESTEPGYQYFYVAQAYYLLPKWYGQPGDTEAFVQTAADRVGGDEGDFMYFYIASGLNCCKARPQAAGMSWDRVKQGFAALEQLYGSTNYQRNAIAFMAVRQGDREFAQQLFARIGNNWNEQVWRTKDKFEEAKASMSTAQ